MSKRKKQSLKVQKKKRAPARPKAEKTAAKATKQVVAKAKPKRAAAKKAAPPVAAPVETVDAHPSNCQERGIIPASLSSNPPPTSRSDVNETKQRQHDNVHSAVFPERAAIKPRYIC
jgi:hypothetical protein